MKELQVKRGTSILFITHDFGVVSQMVDRLAVMQQGELQQLLHRPQHHYTRQLLDALPENLEKECHLRTQKAFNVIGAEVTTPLALAPGESLIRLR